MSIDFCSGDINEVSGEGEIRIRSLLDMFVEVVRLCDNRGRGWEKGLPKEVSFFVVGDGSGVV